MAEALDERHRTRVRIDAEDYVVGGMMLDPVPLLFGLFGLHFFIEFVRDGGQEIQYLLAKLENWPPAFLEHEFRWRGDLNWFDPERSVVRGLRAVPAQLLQQWVDGLHEHLASSPVRGHVPG